MSHTPWKDLTHKSTPEQVAAAALATDEAIALHELRKAREMTQTQLAAALDVTQPAISRIEHSTDVYVSTLRSYVRALGGELEICARFDGTTLRIGGFEELDDVDEPSAEHVLAV